MTITQPKVKLIWATPEAEKLLVYCARVSNPKSQEEGGREDRLISYLLKHKHFSPFEMVDACLEIECSRAIARQILRHRSFFFQEFSQRYSVVEQNPVLTEARIQDLKNRQASHPTADALVKTFWESAQQEIWSLVQSKYNEALQLGIAKEQARAILPEGMTTSKMYMKGSLRSWIHYIDLRTGVETQKEHREIAELCKQVIVKEFPLTAKALGWIYENN
jgi:thymidylate synthase (FAD)